MAREPMRTINSGLFFYFTPFHFWTFRAPDWENCPLCVTLFSYTRAFGDGARTFEPWPSDEDDTSAVAPPSPNFQTTPTGGRLSSRQI
ncbi:hypothetical protein TNCV_2736851 [Trichonephila clavipes]|nr:hypothetical protein TNCV_2736851 [Trichonephila clavipes]